MDELTIVSRFVQFGAVSLLFGAALFRSLIVRPRLAGHAPGDGFSDWLQRLFVLAATLALLSALGWFAGVAVNMAGTWSDALGRDTITAVLFDTRFGLVWTERLALIAAIFILLARRWRRPRMVEFAMLALSGALVASLAGIGHGSAGEGWLGVVHLFADMVHLLCAAAWLGGLVCLGYVLHKRLAGVAVAMPDVRTTLPRFSRIGYFAVAVLLVSGCVNAIVMVPSLEALIGTVYGRVLLIKLALVGLMAAVALVNRLVVTPRIIRSDTIAAVALLWRNVVMEQSLGVMVLAAVAVLGTIHPAP